jgi:hypothetical protein
MIRSHGGIFGRNPAFQNVEVQGDLTVDGSATIVGTTNATNINITSGTIGNPDAGAAITFDSSNQVVSIGDVNGAFNGIGIIVDNNVGAITLNGFVDPINGLASKGTQLNNIAIGDVAGATLSLTAQDNVLVGAQAGDAITSGDRNIGIGTNAVGAVTTTSDCVGIGYQALLLNTASGLVAIGSNALDANTTGTNNVAIGLDAATAINTGASNLAIGTNALKVATTVSDNVAIGVNALQAKTSSGNGNVAIGTSALYRATTCAFSTAIGYQSQFGSASVTAQANTSLGYNSMVAITSGSYNSAFGINALYGLTTGAQNTACGTEALYAITTTSNNTGVGQLALRYATTGSQNTAIGYLAGAYKTASNTNNTLPGDWNVYIGGSARASGDSVTNEVVIGGNNPLGLGSNTTTIGTTATTATRIYGVASTGQVAPTIASAATIAPTTSVVFISGTTQINTITAPTLITGTGGQITLIPTGLWTTGTTGNIALASTAVVSRALIMTYDAGTAKWYPSY